MERKSLFSALFFTLFMVISNYTLTMSAAIYVVSDLGGSSYTTIYSISYYAIGNALGVPLGRALSRQVGSVRLLSICLFLFALFSFLCGIAPTYFLFVAFRFFQGLVSGPFYTLLNRLFGSLTPPEKKKHFTAITLGIFIMGPVIGAVWGGWVSYFYFWRYIFFFNLPLILFLAIFIPFKLKNYEPHLPALGFDPIGYIFYFLGVFSLATVLIVGQELDWYRSNLIIWLTIIGIPCFLSFVIWTLFHPYPLLDLRLLKRIEFPFALVNLGLLFGIYFGMLILLSLWLALYVNYTPIWVGLLIGIMAVSGLIPTFFIFHGLGKFDSRFALIVAIIFLAISSFHTSLFNVDIDLERIASSRILAGFGLALFLPPVFNLAFRGVPEEKSVDVVVIFQFVRALSSGLGASLFVILWERRKVFYHTRLGGTLTPYSQKTQDFLINARKYVAPNQEKSLLAQFLDREATSLALNDCFYLMGWLLIVALIFVLLTHFVRRIDFQNKI